MSSTRVKTSSISQGFPKSRSLLAGNDTILSGAYESIATVTVGSGGQATAEFTSIPSTYKHLQIRYFSADSRTGTPFSYVMVTFNSDSASNYSEHELYADGASVAAGGGSNNKIPCIGGDATHYGAGVIDILDYASTNKYKTLRCISGSDENGSGFIQFNSGSWRSLNAISTITLTAFTANYRQYSSFALYGIR